jgi:hypothetical protein
MLLSIRILLFVSLSLYALNAWAYLDPGTGSMLISAIVGIVASIGLALKTWWYKIKGFFRGKPDEDKQPPADGTD